MVSALYLLSLQGILGAFDNIWNHELGQRLPYRQSARRELMLHAGRGMLYAPVFLSFGWIEWRGLFGWVFVAVLLAELGITLMDFVEEDRSRKLPALERITHAILTINYGAFLALAAPEILAGLARPTGFALVDRGWLGQLMIVYALGSFAFGCREALAARRLGREAGGGNRIEIVHAPEPTGRSVLVAGGTGFIGRALVQRLIERGDRVVVLSRDPGRAQAIFGRHALAIGKLEDMPATVAIDAVVNLAGAPIVGLPWTKARKRELVESRIGTTRDLVAWMSERPQRPEVLVNASAIGWYGTDDDATFTESAPMGADFPAILCGAWEREAAAAAAAGIRVCRLRIGLVLGREGGMLRSLLPSYRLGMGGRIGDGRQWLSWIHRDDVVELIVRALADPGFDGVLNATAPEPVRQVDFARVMAKALHRPALLRLPALPLRLAMGEMSSLLLEGQRVLPQRALDLGFVYRFPTLDRALQDLLSAGDREPRGRRAAGSAIA